MGRCTKNLLWRDQSSRTRDLGSQERHCTTHLNRVRFESVAPNPNPCRAGAFLKSTAWVYFHVYVHIQTHTLYVHIFICECIYINVYVYISLYIYIDICLHQAGVANTTAQECVWSNAIRDQSNACKNNLTRCQHFRDHLLLVGPSNCGCHRVNLFINETDRAVVIHKMILVQCAHNSHEVCLHDLNSCSAWPPDLSNT